MRWRKPPQEHGLRIAAWFNMSVVSGLSDTITVLQRGQILAEGPYDQVSNNPDVIEAYMGTGHG